MLSAQVSELQLTEYWCETDPTLRGRLDLPMHTGNGAASSAVIYFEHQPGEHHGRHTDSAEEVVLVLDGEAEVTAGDQRLRLSEGTSRSSRRWSRTTSPTSGGASFAWSASSRAPRWSASSTNCSPRYRTRVLTLGAPEEQPDGSAA